MSVASKNLFALLGNDEEEPPSGPVKTVDKQSTHTTKRSVEPVAPVKPAGQATRRGPGGNEGAFRDRNAGSYNNRGKPTDEATRGGGRGGRGARDRGGRGGRFPRERDDRHAKNNLPSSSEKQAAQGWGATEGQAEAKDEQAGEEMAQKEIKEAAVEDGEGIETPAEPEEKQLSYDEYLAQQAEKKLALGGDLTVRKANEGSKSDKKWDAAKVVKSELDDFMPSSGGKAKRERERKQKQVVDIDQRYVEPDRPRGGGASRGGAPRGGAPRGGAGRGEGRGGRGRGGRGGSENFRGGRTGGPRDAAGFNANDQSAFPSLGA